MINQVKTMMILPKTGLKVRSDKFPHKAISENTPTRVIRNAYWNRRLESDEIMIVDETVQAPISPVAPLTSPTLEVKKDEASSELSVDETESKKSKKKLKE